MEKPPSVFFFGEGSYDELGRTNQWTIDIVSADLEHAQDLKRAATEKWMERLLNNHRFAVQQTKEVFEDLYDGNDFGAAVVALIKTDDRTEKDLECKHKWEQYAVEIDVCERYPYSIPDNIKAPLDISDLLSKQPQEYGSISQDDSSYSDTAYPMSLTFRPMSTLRMANKFRRNSGGSDSIDRPELDAVATDAYATAVIHVKLKTPSSQFDGNSTENVREMLGLQDEVDGLRELSVLERDGHKTDIWFLSGKNF
jgi:hypothetical protein